VSTLNHSYALSITLLHNTVIYFKHQLLKSVLIEIVPGFIVYLPILEGLGLGFILHNQEFHDGGNHIFREVVLVIIEVLSINVIIFIILVATLDLLCKLIS
jgi:hypothetical protein